MLDAQGRLGIEGPAGAGPDGADLRVDELDELVTRRLRLDEINDGFAALKRGEVVRAVVCYDA